MNRHLTPTQLQKYYLTQGNKIESILVALETNYADYKQIHRFEIALEMTDCLENLYAWVVKKNKTYGI